MTGFDFWSLVLLFFISNAAFAFNGNDEKLQPPRLPFPKTTDSIYLNFKNQRIDLTALKNRLENPLVFPLMDSYGRYTKEFKEFKQYETPLREAMRDAGCLSAKKAKTWYGSGDHFAILDQLQEIATHRTQDNLSAVKVLRQSAPLQAAKLEAAYRDRMHCERLQGFLRHSYSGSGLRKLSESEFHRERAMGCGDDELRKRAENGMLLDSVCSSQSQSTTGAIVGKLKLDIGRIIEIVRDHREDQTFGVHRTGGASAIRDAMIGELASGLVNAQIRYFQEKIQSAEPILKAQAILFYGECKDRQDTFCSELSARYQKRVQAVEWAKESVSKLKDKLYGLFSKTGPDGVGKTIPNGPGRAKEIIQAFLRIHPGVVKEAYDQMKLTLVEKTGKVTEQEWASFARDFCDISYKAYVSQEPEAISSSMKLTVGAIGAVSGLVSLAQPEFVWVTSVASGVLAAGAVADLQVALREKDYVTVLQALGREDEARYVRESTDERVNSAITALAIEGAVLAGGRYLKQAIESVPGVKNYAAEIAAQSSVLKKTVRVFSVPRVQTPKLDFSSGKTFLATAKPRLLNANLFIEPFATVFNTSRSLNMIGAGIVSQKIWSTVDDKVNEIEAENLDATLASEVDLHSPEGQYLQAYKALLSRNVVDSEMRVEERKQLLSEIRSFRSIWETFMNDSTGDIRLPREQMLESAKLLSISDARALSSEVKTVIQAMPKATPQEWMEQLKQRLKSEESPFLDRPFLTDYILPSVILPSSIGPHTAATISMLGHTDPVHRFVLQMQSTEMALDPKKIANNEAAFATQAKTTLADAEFSPEKQSILKEFEAAQKVFAKDPLASELGLIESWRNSKLNTAQTLDAYVTHKRNQLAVIRSQKDAWTESKVGHGGIELMVQATLGIGRFKDGTSRGDESVKVMNPLRAILTAWLKGATARNEEITNEKVISETQWLALRYLEIQEKQSHVAPDSPPLKDALRANQREWNEFEREVALRFNLGPVTQ